MAEGGFSVEELEGSSSRPVETAKAQKANSQDKSVSGGSRHWAQHELDEFRERMHQVFDQMAGNEEIRQKFLNGHAKPEASQKKIGSE